MARKSKYDPNTFPLLVEGYAREGMLEKDIAAKLGVGHDAFNRYKNKYKEFKEALKRGKAPVDTVVENALLKRALGYEYEEEKITSEGERDKKVIIKKEVTKKIMPPDVTAQIFWLKNRKPKQWRDKPEQAAESGVKIIVENGIIKPV